MKELKIKPIEVKKSDKRHTDAFDNLYPNILLIAKKNSGKTTVIYNLIESIISKYKETKEPLRFIFFCGQAHQDPGYSAIFNLLESNKIDFVIETSFKDEDDNDQLKALVNHLKKEKNEEDTFIIIDDLSSELKMKSLDLLLKQNRHMHTTVIIATQDSKDLSPSQHQQINIPILFKDIPIDKKSNRLENLYSTYSLPLTYKEFEKKYKETAKGYEFLTIDRDNNKLRKNLGPYI